MIDLTKVIVSVTALRRHSGEFIKQLKKTEAAHRAYRNGKPEAVVQEAAPHQRLLAIAPGNSLEGIRQGPERFDRGEVQYLDELFVEFES